MEVTWIRGVLLVVFGYLLGSVPFGILVTRLFDRSVNLRGVGSGNIGATNVARAAGKGAGALTLALDAGKGVVPMVLTYMLIGEDYLWLSLVGGAVFLGHVFPVYLRFKGGKGVATALGVILSLSSVTTFLLIVLFVLVVYFTRYVSLGSLCAAVALPILMALLGPPSRYCVTLSLLIAFLVIYNHRENIHRLLNGQENRLGK
ncbi:MAG: acyl-phosphate glycerol 3-phosphate acyltransferase [Deltaproteobacteria bacterium]|nr:MAG: acyl-phosphate glycerol 3-phosphate acyltransferase [Deltaproteobacteria bacterium]